MPAEQVRGSIQVTAEASDPSGVTSVAFSATGPGGSFDLGEDSEAPFVATWDTTAVPDGEYAIVATATDDAGNEGESDPATVLVDNTPPTVTLATPEAAEGGYLLSAEAEDGGSGVASGAVRARRRRLGHSRLAGARDGRFARRAARATRRRSTRRGARTGRTSSARSRPMPSATRPISNVERILHSTLD